MNGNILSMAKRCSVLLAGTLCLVANGSAAEAQPGAVIRALLYERVGALTEVEVLGADGEPQGKEPLELPVHQLSAPFAVSSRELVFRPRASGGAGVGPPAPIASVKLPGAGRDFLLMFLPGTPESGKTYLVQAIPFSPERVGSGAFAFINYSGSPIAGVIGTRKFTVDNGKMGVCRPSKDEGAERILCYEFDKANNKWLPQPFFSSRIVVQKGVRNFVIVTRDPHTGQIAFRGIPDFLSG